jgi:uncharacterized protein YjiS (DUF1127 family)
MIALQLSRALQHAAALLATWRRRLRERRELAAMDERTRHDLGLSRFDAFYEARKPFWRA